VPEFKLFGGPHHGRITQSLDPFQIETWMVPRMGSKGLEYDVYTRRECDDIYYFAHEGLADSDAERLLRSA
jgi:hypothetical protein